jgi:hypothetical protein
MAQNTQNINLPLLNNNNSAPVASNEINLPNNNLNQNNLVKVSRNIPVDLNSEIPLHERWNCHQSRAPAPVPNGGLFGGPQATGAHASIPVIPTATNMIHHNLRSANPPPGAIHQYPGTNRDKNNYIAMPGVYWYNDTHPVNVGPHSIKVIDNSHPV